jgi:DNA invertase Pin-like site-specific DNA recombinase
MQNEKSSEDQAAQNRALAASRGWTISDEFTDESRSGRRSRNRPNFNRMIEEALVRRPKMIIVEDISRLCRNAAEMHVIAQRLGEAGIVIVSTDIDRVAYPTGGRPGRLR